MRGGAGEAGRAVKKKGRARKTSTAPSRIYSYRCLPPVEEASRVEDQFRLAAQYRNKLVEVEHGLRAQIRDAQLAHPEIGDALRAVEDAQRAVEDALAALREAKSGTATPELARPRALLSAAKTLRAQAIERLRASKRGSADLGQLQSEAERAQEDVDEAGEHVDAAATDVARVAREAYEARCAQQPADAALLSAYGEARRAAHTRRLQARHDYSDRGLRHGAYDRVEKAVQRAATSARRPLRFERYDGSGSIGTQLTARIGGEVLGMTLGELASATDTRLRLGPPGATDAHPREEVVALHPGGPGSIRRLSAWEAAARLPRNVRRHAARTWVEIRIGSHPDRSPIFARFPVTLHRLPPPDAVIKWAYIVRRRVGHRLEWRLQLTLESRALGRLPVALGTGACAINLGWRRILDDEGRVVGLRAAYVVDTEGREHEVRVPDYVPSHGPARSYPVLGAVGKCDDLSRIRDRALEAAQLQLSAWLAERGGVPAQWQAEEPPGPGGAARRPMADRLRGYSAWRAAWRLRRFVDLWRTRRVPGDEHVFEVLVAWARQDRHLETWQASARDRQIAHRREAWRIVAAELCRRYEAILVGEGLLTEIDGWERPAPEDGDPADGRLQRRMARIAAPGELLAELQKAAWKTGATIRRCGDAGATQTCALCGHAEPWDARSSVLHTCAGCGATWDQDGNYGRNLLARKGYASDPSPRAGDPPPANAPESSRTRSRRGSSCATTEDSRPE